MQYAHLMVGQPICPTQRCKHCELLRQVTSDFQLFRNRRPNPSDCWRKACKQLCCHNQILTTQATLPASLSLTVWQRPLNVSNRTKCSESAHSRLGNAGSHPQIDVDVDNEVTNGRPGRDDLRATLIGEKIIILSVFSALSWNLYHRIQMYILLAEITMDA